MTVKTYSAWTFGHIIDSDNNTLPFSENGVDELVGTLNVGGYTLDSFANEVARAMNAVGTLNYIVTVDRSTRKLAVSGDSSFFLYVTSSTLSAVSPYSLMGFTTERSGASTYIGDEASGNIFEPQFFLQSFVPFENFERANSVNVLQSATGQVQVVKYGTNNFMECNITLQTDITQGKDSVIQNKPGETQLREFLQFAVGKTPMEFIADVDTPATFTDCILEKTRADAKGTGFKLIELYSKGFADWFETGTITFREIK